MSRQKTGQPGALFDMLETIRELERVARQLDPGAEQRQALLSAVGDYAESFLAALPEAKTYTQDSGQNGFTDYPLQDSPADIAEVLQAISSPISATAMRACRLPGPVQPGWRGAWSRGCAGWWAIPIRRPVT